MTYSPSSAESFVHGQELDFFTLTLSSLLVPLHDAFLSMEEDLRQQDSKFPEEEERELYKEVFPAINELMKHAQPYLLPINTLLLLYVM